MIQIKLLITFLTLLSVKTVSGRAVFKRQNDLQPANVNTQCSGGFDVYFVLDKSGSISPTHFQEQTVNFVEELYNRFTSSQLRVSFIVFSSIGEIILPLTSDRDAINRGLEELRVTKPGGGTMLAEGLYNANTQIRKKGDSSASVVIALTDGQISDKTNSEMEANTTRDLGGNVLAVRIGVSSTEDILGVANHPPEDHIFNGATFDDLENIITKIINTSCVEILSADPNEVCINEAFNVSIYGNGFDKTVNLSTVFCNFKLNGTNQRVKPYNVTSRYLLCLAPPIYEEEGFIEVEVSVNGKAFISSNVTVTAHECVPPNLLPLVLSILGLIFLVALFLLWWFWNLLCCAVVLKEDNKPPPVKPSPVIKPRRPPPPRPTPPPLVPGPSKVKKWPKVDVSLIGGVGAGGIRPVQVKWGSTGNTEAAMHLQRGKQAQIVGQIEIETPGEMIPNPIAIISKPKVPPAAPMSKEKNGCCACCSFSEKMAKLFAPFKSLYERISVMRPQPGEKGRCCSFKRE